MSLTYTLADLLVNAVGRGIPFSMEGWYLGAFTSAPSRADGLPAGHEVTTANGYARIAITFPAPVSGLSDVGLVYFPVSTGAWGTITHLGLCSAATGGLVHLWDELTSPVSVNAASQTLQVDLGLRFW